MWSEGKRNASSRSRRTASDDAREVPGERLEPAAAASGAPPRASRGFLDLGGNCASSALCSSMYEVYVVSGSSSTSRPTAFLAKRPKPRLFPNSSRPSPPASRSPHLQQASAAAEHVTDRLAACPDARIEQDQGRRPSASSRRWRRRARTFFTTRRSSAAQSAVRRARTAAASASELGIPHARVRAGVVVALGQELAESEVLGMVDHGLRSHQSSKPRSSSRA